MKEFIKQFITNKGYESVLDGLLKTVEIAVIGLIIGIGICLIQQHFGILQLGNGAEYIVSAYPVVVQASDLIIVSCTVLVLGFLAAWIPARRIKE